MSQARSQYAGRYEEKEDSYFGTSRSELLQFVPQLVRTILDVGCGAAEFSATLKKKMNAEVWGVEVNSKAALIASERLDKVINDMFSSDLNLPQCYFDLICFNDVLEHMPEPREALIYAKKLLTPNGQILASIPNFRHFNTIWKLVVQKSAEYEDYGIMDRTHLRIFTKSSIVRLFQEAGLIVERIEGINGQFVDPRFRFWNKVTFGWISDMQWLQFATVAVPRHPDDVGKRFRSGQGE